MTAFSPPVGEPPAVQFFAPDRLSVDHAYQRQLKSERSQKLVFAIASAWDWRLCTPLLVSERADGLFILDGQHRWAAAKLRGDIPFLPCAVGRFASIGEEAMLFVAANRKRVQVSRIDLFRAAVAAGNEAEVAVDALVRAAGLRIAEHTNPHHYAPGEVGFTSGLLTALRREGTQLVGRTLAVMGEAFEGEVLRLGGVMFQALLVLLKSGGSALDRDQLVATLRRRHCDDWAVHPRVSLKAGAARHYELRAVILEHMGLAPPAPRHPAVPRTDRAPKSFEERLAAVESGKAKVVPKLAIRAPAHEQTLGGVASGML